MNNILINWGDFNLERLIVQSAIVFVISIAYIALIVIDFRDKEMWFLQEFGVGLANSLFLIAAVAIWGSATFIKPIIIGSVMWIILVSINSLLSVNNPSRKLIIGEADIDLFSLQFCLSASYLIWFFQNDDSGMPYTNLLLEFNFMLSALLVGLIITAVIWTFVFIYKLVFKNPNRNSIRTIYKEHQKVPLLLSVLPITVVNMFLIMGT